MEGGVPALAEYDFTVLGARTLTAHFETRTYSVTVDKNIGLGNEVCCDTVGVEYEELVTVTATPAPEFDFIHWLEKGKTNPVSLDSVYTFPVTKDRDLIAIFEFKKFNITLSENPSGSGMVYGGGYNLPFNTDTAIWAVPFDNYIFLEWTHEDGTPAFPTDTVDIVVTKSAHYIAQFTPRDYHITVDVEPHPGAGQVIPPGGWYTFGQTANLLAEPNGGYVFKHWKENTDTIWNEAPYNFVVHCDRHLIAVFELQTLYVTVTPDPNPVGGTVTGTDYNLAYGDTHTVTATANQPHYKFVDWTENGISQSSSHSYTFQVLNNRVLIANFISEEYTIKLLASNPEHGTVEGGGTFYYNVPCTAQANAEVGYAFTHWTENGETISPPENPYIFLVTADRILMAHFETCAVDVNLVANPQGWGSVEGGGENIPCNKELLLKATPTAAHYSFKNWTEGTTVISTEAEFTFLADHTCALTANFTLKNYLITVAAEPSLNGNVTGGGPYDYGDTATVSASAVNGFMFTHWSEEGISVSTEKDYTFKVDKSRDLIAHFEKSFFIIDVIPNDSLYGSTFGSGKYELDQPVTAVATPFKGYLFSGWTINDTVVDINHIYEFPATRSITLVANFYGLDFDKYAATLWDNTFLLNLGKLEDEGYEITDCKWYKNNKELRETNTLDPFSYSAGPNQSDKLELAPTYYHFHLTTHNGMELYSTKKVLQYYDYYPAPAPNKLYVYPNPAESGMVFTVENATKGTLMQVYNQYGLCVKTLTTPDTTVTLSLNLPAGIYLIKNENKEAKVVITR
jgi:hypothetical protein